MRVIEARNVHDALPRAVRMILEEGYRRESRNGPVLVMPTPVTTVYDQPLERVVFWPMRDANPAFHLYEALWMLAGRNDLAPLTRYVKDFGRFSDDGQTLRGAYGYRWRYAFDEDQLLTVADRLRQDPNDRRSVLQMWDATTDLGADSRDVPCNLVATFQRDFHGFLDMTVFCRSNDIVWGAYGANAVHFSFLQEYLALLIDCQVGTYTHVSVNWHAYTETLEKLRALPGEAFGGGIYSVPTPVPNPYTERHVRPVLMRQSVNRVDVDAWILMLLEYVDAGCPGPLAPSEWVGTMATVFRAHEVWRTLKAPTRFLQALQVLGEASILDVDWVVAMREWVERRRLRWEQKQDSTEEAWV